MELTHRDIDRIAKLGFPVEYFAEYSDGFYRLKNVDGHCVFLDVERGRCKIYRYRPLGCRIYPVIYDFRDGFKKDDFCPAINTIDDREFKSRVNALKWVLRQLL